MGIEAGTRHKVSVRHAEVRAWAKSAQPRDELRAGKGLYLRCTNAGLHWLYRYASPETGKQVRVWLWADDAAGLIGFPDATLEEAERRAARLRAAVLDGVDPVLRAEQARAAADAAQAAQDEAQRRRITVRDLFDRWRDVELVRRSLPNGDSTGRRDSGALAGDTFRRHVFPVIGDMAAEAVGRADVLRVIDAQVTAGKQRTAQMIFADLRQMLAFGLDRELITVNPMATLKKSRIVGTSTERERALSTEEIQALAQQLPAARMSPRSVLAVWVTLATGCRVGEVMGAAWADLATDRAALVALADGVGSKCGFVDLPGRSWYIPDTKSGRDHTVHLSPFAVSIFMLLRGMRDEGPWVFANSAGSAPLDAKTFAKQLGDRQRAADKQIKGRTKAVGALILPGGRWTPHDLRRTAASIMAALGVNGDTIDECLNHQIESRIRRTYIRDRREADQARAFDALGARLSELAGLVVAGGHPADLPNMPDRSTP
jgi:integrase